MAFFPTEPIGLGLKRRGPPSASALIMDTSKEPTSRHQHISKQFEQELTELRHRVLTLGGFVEEQIALALYALNGDDLELAERVIRDDTEVNLQEIAIDGLCTEILARRQPAASDLRLVMAAIKTINDLERIGDDAKFIARCTLALATHRPPRSQLRPLHGFGLRLCAVLKATLDAYARMDVTAALRIKGEDCRVDSDYRDIVEQQIASMSQDGRTIPIGLNLVWAARALERIGDRCCNICEYVIYYVKGKDIRHISLDQAVRDIDAV